MFAYLDRDAAQLAPGVVNNRPRVRIYNPVRNIGDIFSAPMGHKQ